MRECSFMQRRLSEGRFSWILLAAILALLLPLKIRSMPGAGPYGLDASYYFQIARHVAEGDGLLTSVSLYHEGLHPLPAPARIYPLWPLLLGWTGRIMGLISAANLVPAALFFLDLVLVYLLSRRLGLALGAHPDRQPFRLIGPLDAGHLGVALFATNPIFWSSTSHPYTEGLALALALGALIAGDSACRSGRPSLAAATGVLSGLAFLARSQMAVLIAAIALVLLILAVTMRKFWVLPVAFLGSSALAVTPWFLFKAVQPVSTIDVGRFVTWTESPNLGAWVSERLPGIWVAFDPSSQLSYFSSFGSAALLVPLALVAAAVRVGMTDGWKKGIPQPSHAILWFTVGIAILNHALLLHHKAEYFLPWLFGWRHGLPFIFALLPATVYLAIFPSRASRVAVAVLVAVTVVTGSLRIGIGTEVKPRQTSGEAAFARWVSDQDRPPTMLTRHAQTFGMLTQGRYHWIECGEPPEQTRRMIDRLGLEYVVLQEMDRGCAFLQGLGGTLEVEEVFGLEGERVWLLRLRNRRTVSEEEGT